MAPRLAAPERLDILAHLHHAALVGAAVGLASEVLHTDGQTKVLIGLGVTVALQQLTDRAAGGRRSARERAIAATVRSILDRHLALERIDHVGFGDYLTLRHLAAAAREDHLRKLVTYGTAHTLARVISELVGDLEHEVGRCYPRLRSRGKARVDAFAAALRSAATAGNAMLNSPAIENWMAEDTRLFDEVARALLAIDAYRQPPGRRIRSQGLSRGRGGACDVGGGEEARRRPRRGSALRERARGRSQGAPGGVPNRANIFQILISPRLFSNRMGSPVPPSFATLLAWTDFPGLTGYTVQLLPLVGRGQGGLLQFRLHTSR